MMASPTASASSAGRINLQVVNAPREPINQFENHLWHISAETIPVVPRIDRLSWPLQLNGLAAPNCRGFWNAARPDSPAQSAKWGRRSKAGPLT
jgi:hypothetical protein